MANALHKPLDPEKQKSAYEHRYKDHLDKGFSYDLAGDALFQQYKDNYMKQGQMAMQDTMGRAAAMTGGYGNSYAATAGNQAYQAYLGQMNNAIPEFYQMAYDRYRQQGADLANERSYWANEAHNQNQFSPAMTAEEISDFIENAGSLVTDDATGDKLASYLNEMVANRYISTTTAELIYSQYFPQKEIPEIEKIYGDNKGKGAGARSGKLGGGELHTRK